MKSVQKYLHVWNENVVTPIFVNKWKTDQTDYNLEDLTLYDISKICFKTIKDSSVQCTWLQLRISHKFLPVGVTVKNEYQNYLHMWVLLK